MTNTLCKEVTYYLGDLIKIGIRTTLPDNLIDNDFKVSIISTFDTAIEFAKSDLVLDEDEYIIEIPTSISKTMKEGSYRIELWIGGTCIAKANNVFKMEDAYSKKFV